jgi:hypothetical protein
VPVKLPSNSASQSGGLAAPILLIECIVTVIAIYSHPFCKAWLNALRWAAMMTASAPVMSIICAPDLAVFGLDRKGASV